MSIAILPGPGGSGNAATDPLWAAKGDLALGTGNDTATILSIGANGTLLIADNTQTTGARWGTVSGSGDVTATSAFTNDNRLVRSDGTGKGVQAGGITAGDDNALTGVLSINGVTITATSGTLTVANGKTLTCGNTVTLAGADGSTLNMGTGGTLGTGAFATIGDYLPLAGGALTGNLVFSPDDSVEIGQSGASRPRRIYVSDFVRALRFQFATNFGWTSGAGSPEGVLSSVVGALYSRTDGGTNTTLYRKESGTGNTGWVAVSNSGAGGGDVAGPAGAADAQLAVYDGTTGKLLGASTCTADASGNLYAPHRVIVGEAGGNDGEVIVKNFAGFIGKLVAGDVTTTRTWAGPDADGTLALTGQLYTGGKETIWIPASAMTPRVSGGAAPGQVEFGTNKVNQVTLDFDTATSKYAQFVISMPKSWNLGTLTFQPVWSHATAASFYGVVWSLAAVAVSDGDALDAACGTAQTSTDTGGTADTGYTGPESSALTAAGSPAAKDTVVFQLTRLWNDAADTLPVDARLLGLRVYYTTNAATDA